MRKIFLLIGLLFASLVAHAQTHAFNGFCDQGGVSANVSGLGSTNKLDGVIPSCQVRVYLTGTTILAPIYAAATGTGSVASVTVTAGGTYSVCPTGVTFSGGGGTGAAGTPFCNGPAVAGVTITAAGSGYTTPPTVAFTGGTGSGGAGTANLAQTLSNPFTATALGSAAPGQWLFYAADGTAYDVVMSGGIAPNVYTQPVTITGLIHGGGGSGGSGPELQTNGVDNFSQTLLDLDQGTNITLTNTSGGHVRIDAVSPLAPFITSPAPGQYVDIYPNHVDTTTLNNVSVTALAGGTVATASANFFAASYCAFPGLASADWSQFTLPSYVNPANVTAVYAIALSGNYTFTASGLCFSVPKTTNINAVNIGASGTGIGPVTLLSSGNLYSLQQSTGLLSGLTGANVSTVHVTASAGNGGDFKGDAATDVPLVFLRVYYTGTPPPTLGNIYIQPPLTYSSVTGVPVLGISPEAAFPGTSLLATNIPNLASSAPGLEFINNGANTTDCSTGGGSSTALCYWNGTTWSAFGTGGGGGVTSINSATGAFTFVGSGVSCTGTSCTFSTGGITGSGTLGFLPKWTSSSNLGNSALDDGVTTAGTVTSSEPMAVASTSSPSQIGLTYNSGHAPTVGSATTAVYAVDSSGNAAISEAGAAYSRPCTAANGVCSSASYTNVVASASGDTTVAAINAKCTGGQTYWASIPLSIATGGTIASGCNVMFVKGGLWTIASGQNVTFANPVRENDGPSQHFTGSGTVTFPAQDAWGEWFGSVGDWNGTTGTDNAAAIQKALNALTAGDVLFQSRAYAVGSTLNMNAANIGMKCSVKLSATPWTGSNICVVVNTSASTDTVDVNIGGGTTQLNNRIYGMDFQRSVNPTGTAAGISSHNTGGFQVSYTTSEDSIYNFKQDTFDGVQYQYISAQWGFEGLTPPTGNYYGIYSTTNLIVNTAFTNADPATGRGSTGTFYGAYQKGVALHDTWIDFLQVNGGTTGWYLEYTGTGTAGDNYDIHLWRPVIDHTFGQPIVIKNVAATADGSVGINSGAVGSANLTSGACIDIESSSGIVVKNMSPISCSAGTADSIIANSSSGISIVNNTFSRTAANTGVLLNSTTNSIVSNNLFYEDGASAAGTGISLVSGTKNVIGQNTFYGKWNVGLSLDSASSGNTALDTNTCSTTTVTCLSETIGNNPLVTNEMKFGTGGVIINLGGGYGMTAFNGATADTAATGIEGGVGDPTLYFNILSTGVFAFRTGGTITATIDDAGNMHPGNGSNIVYRCATAGTLPAGALTITSGDCGTTTDTGLRVK